MSSETHDPDDEKFEQWLPTAARDYNRPPDAIAPAHRDSMWGAIEASLDATPAAPAVPAAPAPVSVTPLTPRRPVLRAWQAAAAVAILAAGIGIGRLWPSRQGTPSDAPSMATAPAGSDAAPASALATRGVPEGGNASGSRNTPAASGVVDGGTSYDVAAVQHLTRAEALLTAFRSNETAEAAPSMNRWARDLLADTRLLLDSPAANDARRRHLLEDLELVLAQIVQLPAESSADRGLVQRSIERGAVLSRLRSTIPAGYTSGT